MTLQTSSTSTSTKSPRESAATSTTTSTTSVAPAFPLDSYKDTTTETSVASVDLEVVETNSMAPIEPKQPMIQDHVSLEDFQKIFDSNLRRYFEEIIQELDMVNSMDDIKKFVSDHHRRVTIKLNKLVQDSKVRVTKKDFEEISNLLTSIMESRRKEVSNMDASLTKLDKLENASLLSHKEIGKISNLLSSIVESSKIDIGDIKASLTKMSEDYSNLRGRMDDMDSQLNGCLIGYEYQRDIDNYTTVCPQPPVLLDQNHMEQRCANMCIFFITIGLILLGFVKMFR